jgi:PelA/Pel-15E family pectate lyase
MPRYSVVACLVLIALTVSLFAPPAIGQDVRIERNIDYLGGDRRERADLYQPPKSPDAPRHPGIVIIHGGGWTGGDKGAAREINIGTTLAANGYVCLSINYALAVPGSPTFPQNIQDCKRAVRWLRRNAERLHVDPEHIGAIGGSAGGHLTALLALAGPDARLDPAEDASLSCRIQAAVPMYPHCAATWEGGTPLETYTTLPMFAKTQSEAPALWDSALPIKQLSKDDPPLLILHGTADTTTPLNQSTRLHEAALAAGLTSKLIVIEGAPHSFHLQPPQRDLRPEVLGFFNEHLRPNSTAENSSPQAAPAAQRFIVSQQVCGLPFPVGGSGETIQEESLTEQVRAAMVRAVTVFQRQAGYRGGYVYEVSLDGSRRRGEGEATATEIWVQPPGTPAVAEAFLDAYDANPNPVFLEAARAAGEALLFGQLESGGWADRVDFDPKGKNAGRYREGRGKAKGRNYSTLDDDKTQSALRFLIRLDQRLKGSDPRVREAVLYALNGLLSAQFANGGFPQGWQQPVEPGEVVRATFPATEWRTVERQKNYWDYETLNDGLAGTVVETLQQAWEAFGEQRFREAQLNFGDFLIRAQLPEPQPAWAQQYNHQLQPIWARKFEPPAAAGAESQDVIRTLLRLFELTGEKRFLEPIPAALAWLQRVRLPDGKLARFYELQTNRPIYFVRETYEPTYDDSRLPTHYSFKGSCHVEQLEQEYKLLSSGGRRQQKLRSLKTLQKDAEAILKQQDAQGRWVTDEDGKPVTKTNGEQQSELLLESRVFAKNLSRLAEYLQAAAQATAN